MPIQAGQAASAADLLNEHNSAGRHGGYGMVNNVVGGLTARSVAVFDTSIDLGFKTTTIAGDASVCGVLVEDIAYLASGHVEYGAVDIDINVQGNVAKGDWLITSTTAGRAMTSGSKQRPLVGGIGIALTSYAGGGAGTVKVRLGIVLYSSVNTLQMLGSVQTFQVAGVSGSQTITVPSGTDGLLILAPGYQSAGSLFTAGAWSAQGLTIVTGGVAHGSYGIGVATLKNPTPGTATLAFSGGNSANYYTVAVICLQSTQATINRTPGTLNFGTATNDTASAPSAVGDLVFDVAIQAATSGQTWTPGAGVTLLVGTAGASNYHSVFVGWAAGLATTTNLQTTWTTSNLYEHQAVAVAGS